MIKIKRVYDLPEEGDGQRILVDRLWPRGLNKNEANIHEWKKELAPSHKLREWFGHDPEKWDEFRKKYQEELKEKKEELREVMEKARKGRVTLLYSAKDKNHNNAQVLKEVIGNMISSL